MNRRHFLRLAGMSPAFVATVALLPDRPPHPPFDKPWPIDIRPGFENIFAERGRIEIWIDDVLHRDVVAVSPKTGHVLKYVRRVRDIPYDWKLLDLIDCANNDPAAFRVYPYEIKFVPMTAPPKTQIGTLPQPCGCVPGMHQYTPGDSICVPYELKFGRIDVRQKV